MFGESSEGFGFTTDRGYLGYTAKTKGASSWLKRLSLGIRYQAGQPFWSAHNKPAKAKAIANREPAVRVAITVGVDQVLTHVLILNVEISKKPKPVREVPGDVPI